MLKINTEYYKGVLFIRLKGRFDKSLYTNTINYLINNFGINTIVLNFYNLQYISVDNINYINQENNKILKKKTKLLIIDNETRRNLFKNTIKIDNEIDAFSLI